MLVRYPVYEYSNIFTVTISADCTWDYFSCTNSYGRWPDNKDCCDQRFNQCCMLVMTWQPTTHRPVISGGYGPAEPEIDIDLGSLENPIDDIDLGDGQSVQRPGVSPVTSELDLEDLCSPKILRPRPPSFRLLKVYFLPARRRKMDSQHQRLLTGNCL